jgi:hypothetical protein
MALLTLGSLVDPIDPPAPEQREVGRTPCGPDTSCRLTLRAGQDALPVFVQNFSEGGINFVLKDFIPIGKTVTVELANPARHFSCTRQLRMLYLIKLDGGDFSAGGVFSEKLSPFEVQGLL